VVVPTALLPIRLTLSPVLEVSLSDKSILYIRTFVFGVNAAPLKTTSLPLMAAVKDSRSLLPVFTTLKEFMKASLPL